jgi:multicomponent Na+:H+ antiporter subunit B
VATALAVVRLRSLFAVVMLSGIYSLITAGIFLTLDAVDVAFTEAAVGAGIATMLMLGTLALTGHKQTPARHSPALPLMVVTITGVVLLWGTHDMPRFEDPDAPIHRHVAPRYIEDSPTEIGLPNMVTSVLASYRGFDTLGEVVVVFTAGVGVLSLLGLRRRRPPQQDGESSEEERDG